MPDELGDRRVALVTGASRGIGRAVAAALGAAGYHVIAIARTTGALEELDDEIVAAGGSASLVPFDLKDFDAIDRLGGVINERYGRLDALVGNAGTLGGGLAPLGHVDLPVWDHVIATNLTANWRLIRSMDVLLRRSAAGRAVFLTSGVGAMPRAYWGAYTVSKAALDALVRTYAAETANTAVRVNLLSPGAVRTRMRAAAMPGEDPDTLPPPEAIAPHVVRLVSPETTESGAVFDVRQGRLLTFQAPA